MLKQAISNLSDEMKHVINIVMIATHSFLIHVPFDKHAKTYMIEKTETWNGETCEQGLPVPSDELLQKYTAPQFLNSGKRHVEVMLNILDEAGYVWESGQRALEFGCASGRMIRWLYPFSKKCEIWGVDINANNLVWCQQFLSPPFKFLTTTRLPHLPFEDRFFNLIYAGSVFTHIDDLADAWLLELRRILKPSGKLYVTIHDNNTIQALNKTQYKQTWLQDYMKDDDHLAQKYQKYVQRNFGMFSILRSHAPHSFLETSPNVFYDLDYFFKHVSPFYRVLSVHPNAYGIQTGILMEK